MLGGAAGAPRARLNNPDVNNQTLVRRAPGLEWESDLTLGLPPTKDAGSRKQTIPFLKGEGNSGKFLL